MESTTRSKDFFVPDEISMASAPFGERNSGATFSEESNKIDEKGCHTAN